MFVKIIAMNEGFEGAIRAGRFWPNGAEVRVEVLPQQDDPPEVDLPAENGKTRKGPDPHRIGRKSFEAIKADRRIKVLADSETSGGISREAFDSAKRLAEDASAALAGAKVEIAQLREENAKLRQELADLKKGAGGAGDTAGAADGDNANGKGTAGAPDGDGAGASGKGKGKGK